MTGHWCQAAGGPTRVSPAQQLPRSQQPGATPVLHKSHAASLVPVATAQDFLATELQKPPVVSLVASISTLCT